MLGGLSGNRVHLMRPGIGFDTRGREVQFVHIALPPHCVKQSVSEIFLCS